MSILLTGASGFIGTNLYKKREEEFLCVVRKQREHHFTNYFEIDSVHSTTNWQGAFDGVDCVIHLAGLAHSPDYSDEEYFEVNNLGCLHLAHEAVKAGVKRFVFVSSIGVNGTITHGKPFDEGGKLLPHNAYAESKCRAEQALDVLSKASGLEVVIIRPTLVYGADAPGNFASLKKIISKTPFLPFGLVNNRRCFISVDNLCDFINTCATHPKAVNETFLISDGTPVSLKEFTNAMAKGMGTTLIQLPVPVWCMRLVAKLLGKTNLANQLLSDLDVDCSKAKKLLNWDVPENMLHAMNKLNRKERKGL